MNCIPLEKSLKSEVLHRVQISKGHFYKVVDMVESDRNSFEIVHQTNAIRHALTSIDSLLIKEHFTKHCGKKFSKSRFLAEMEKVFDLNA